MKSLACGIVESMFSVRRESIEARFSFWGGGREDSWIKKLSSIRLRGDEILAFIVFKGMQTE